MKYKYYGTAAYEGIPALWCECDICERARRLGGKNIMSRSQQTIDDKILIDFSADTFMHTLAGLPLTQIHTCLITHDHSDHFYPQDIAARLCGYAHPKEETPITVYSMHAGIEHAKRILAEEQRTAQSRVNLCEIEAYKSFVAEGYTITPLKANHDPKSDPVIYLIEKEGKCVLHANDTGYFPEETWDYLEKHLVHIDFVTFDSTLTREFIDNNKTDGHMNLPTVKNVRDRLRDIGMIDDTTICVLNHFSHNGLCIYDELVEIGKQEEFLVSYDGLEIEI